MVLLLAIEDLDCESFRSIVQEYADTRCRAVRLKPCRAAPTHR